MIITNQTAALGFLVGIFGFFLVTTCFMGYTLEGLDDEDLLNGSNDGRMKKWGSGLRKSHSPHSQSHPDSIRQDFESYNLYPEDLREYVNKLHKELPPTSSGIPYEIHNCPDLPPHGYPYAWNLLDLLNNWNPDNTTLPSRLHQGLCVFDWITEEDKANRYRQSELPFIVKNHPELLKTAYRWNQPNYIEAMVGEREYRNEHSMSNHMMFWRTHHLGKKDIPNGWKPPTEDVALSFRDWKRKAQELETRPEHTAEEHWYFRMNAVLPTASKSKGNNAHIYKELPIFHPSKPAFFMVNPDKARGINCRFGMRGVIAEAHFDPSRNFVVLLGGQRRYVLAHPDQCVNMELYPFRHPSGRHSSIDWSHPPDASTARPFTKAMANEVVLQAGDALYLPTSWFHFIVSLNENYQCNARSGVTYENEAHISKCGLGSQPHP